MFKPALIFLVLILPISVLAQNLRDIPHFAVTINLSAKAASELNKRNETIVAMAYFGGYAAKEHLDKAESDGEIPIADQRVEIPKAGTAIFDGLKYDQDKVEWIEDKKLSVLINVVSGRHSSPDNLLDCDIYRATVDQATIDKINLNCKLIEED